MKRSRSGAAGTSLVMLLGLLLTGCTLPFSSTTPPPPVPTAAANLTAGPTAAVTAAGRSVGTPGPTPKPAAGTYNNPDLGFSFRYPLNRVPDSTQGSSGALVTLRVPAKDIVTLAYMDPLPTGSTLEVAAKKLAADAMQGTQNPQQLQSVALSLDDGTPAWLTEYSARLQNGDDILLVLVSATRGGRVFTLMTYGAPDAVRRDQTLLSRMNTSMVLSAPQAYGIPRDEALFQLGGESNNPRDYDPATGGDNSLLYSGLVMFDPQLHVLPDLADGWTISADGTVYTFHLRPNARFHDGRPVTAADVIYSWERAADPKTASTNVLTYLGDIVGMADKRAGKAATVSGLKALDDHRLQVTIDAPKPYFLMKLAYGISVVLDKKNVESGADWYTHPNGTGPYKLLRSEPGKVIIYERNPDFYGAAPPIRYVVQQLYAGVGIRLYETGDIDITGVSRYDLPRVHDPDEPLHADLHEAPSLCTSYLNFDVTQAPFDDVKVRQAFALAIDKAKYRDLALNGSGLIARGLYPPGLPGYSLDLHGLDYNPTLAKQRLAESRYGSAQGLPPLRFTVSGFGSDLGAPTAALVAMWQQTLSVTVQVEKLEPDRYNDEVHAGRHGQILSNGWCADYPDPENFADALFHTGAEENLSRYSNPTLDHLLEQARVEPAPAQRMALYAQAEQLLVDDAPALFLSHGQSAVLVKPYVKGYVLAPIAYPEMRYLSLDPAGR